MLVFCIKEEEYKWRTNTEHEFKSAIYSKKATRTEKFSLGQFYSYKDLPTCYTPEYLLRLMYKAVGCD